MTPEFRWAADIIVLHPQQVRRETADAEWRGTVGNFSPRRRPNFRFF